MKKGISLLVLTMVLVLLTGCGYKSQKCETETDEDADMTGSLYISMCVDEGRRLYGLFNGDGEQVLPEIYHAISDGKASNNDFMSDYIIHESAEYIRLTKGTDVGYETSVIDRNGEFLFDFIPEGRVLISEDQETIYIKNGTDKYLLDIESNERTIVTFEVYYDRYDYYISFDDNEEVIVDSNFNVVLDEIDGEFKMLYEDLAVYEKDNTIYTTHLISGVVTELYTMTRTYDEVRYVSKYVFLKENPYNGILIDVEKNMTKVLDNEVFDSLRNEGYYLTETDDKYLIYDETTHEVAYTYDKLNREVLDPYYIIYYSENDNHVIENQLRALTLKANVSEIDARAGYVEVVYEENNNMYYDPITLELLFERDGDCEMIADNTDLFIFGPGCQEVDARSDIEFINIVSARYDLSDYRISTYNDEYICLRGNNELIWIDREGNVVNR